MANKFKTILILLLFSMILNGCARINPRPLNTGSGRPEIVISSSKKAATISEISNKMLDKGYTLVEENTSKIVFEKENFQNTKSKIAVGVLFGGEDSRERVVFNFLSKNEQAIRVMVDVFFVRADAKGDNRVTARRQFYPEWQKFLDDLDSKDSKSDISETTNKLHQNKDKDNKKQGDSPLTPKAKTPEKKSVSVKSRSPLDL